MAKRRNTKDSFFAGLLVVFAIIAGVTIVIAISGGIEVLTSRKYTVAFSLDQGVPNLERGSDVQIGGLRVGSVGDIRFDTDDDGNPEQILVQINVDRRYRLREDAEGILKEPLLGGKSVINFGTPGTASQPVAATDFPLSGKLSGGLLAAAGIDDETVAGLGDFISGLGGETGQNVSDIVTNIKATSERVNRVSETLEANWAPAVTGTLTDTSELIATLSEDYPEYRDRTYEFLDAATEASRGTQGQIEQLRQEAEEFLTLLSEVIEENRVSVRTTITNIESSSDNTRAITERVRDETMDLITQTMRDAQSVVNRTDSALVRVDELLIEQTPTIRRTIANLRLSADQLRDTLIEVRRSPWRLLYRPDQRETAYELLYDTARSYAGAVSDLRAASEALDAITAAAERRDRPLNPELIEQLTTHLESSFNDYADAERRFLELITGINQE